MLERQQEVPVADPGDELWKDMVKAEEQRLKEREEDESRLRKEREKKHKPKREHKKAEPKDDDSGDKDEKK